MAWLPGMIEHRCGVGERGGFFERLREGTWSAHILEHVVLELQNLAGMRTGFGQTRSTSQRGVYKMAFRTREEHVGRAALAAARDLLMAAINDEAYDLEAALAPLRDMVDSRCLGPSTASIVDAATERRIPSLRLNDGNLVQLGHGAAQRRIWTAETDRTSAIAEGIASDKDLTKFLLKSCGVRGARRQPGAQRRSGLGRSAGHRRARRRQAVRRQPWPRRLAEPDDGSRREGRLRTGRAQGRQLGRAGGKLHHGRRTPPARGRQQADRGRQGRIAVGRRRRRLHRAGTGEHADQYRPAPRRRRRLPTGHRQAA